MRHSPLGASGAERWMHCPGSITLLKEAQITAETDEPSYRVDGTTAHAGALWCLENGADAWECQGTLFEGNEFTADMAVGVQLYLDAVRADITPNSIVYYEQQIEDAAVHHYFFGTTDCGVVEGEWLIVSDYKNGAGIPVDAKGNPQIRYYAYGLLRKIQDPRVKWVRLRIVQPNAFHPEGPIREDEISADELCRWAETELVPAMRRTEIDGSLEPGSHCRFCPAKLVCPAMHGLFGAVAEADASAVQPLTDEELGRRYVLAEAVKIYIKALGMEAYQRLVRGKTVAGAKLVEKKAGRVWKAGAADRIRAEFGDKAYGERRLLSPAQAEKLPGAAPLVKEWAYSPKTGYTVEPATSKRRAVVVTNATQAFQQYADNMDEAA